MLKPSTHLYYFSSPGDTEPRGCIDLEHANVDPVEYLPDGRFRFEISFDGGRVTLEARSEDVGQEWMQALQQERLSQAKIQLHELQRKHELTHQKMDDLEHQLTEYRTIEQDRDDAVEDSADWKRKFERLNETLRLLTQHLRKPLLIGGEEVYKDTSSSHLEKQSNDDHIDELNENKVKTNVISTPARDTSLLDSIDHGEARIEELDVPGTHFTALNNTVQQLRENVRLASIEASSALDDLGMANEKMTALEKRMLKAEKKLCEQWEENCTIRQELKIVKQERKVLVKEIKVSRTKSAPTLMQGRQIDMDEELGDIVYNIGREGERLLEELEEHVCSSITLNNRYLAASPSLNNVDALHLFSRSDANISGTADSGVTLKIENTTSGSTTSPLRPKTLSLFDQDSDDMDSTFNDDDIASTDPSCVSSVGAELGEGEFGLGIDTTSDDDSRIDRKHPLLKLDEEEDEESSQPNLCPASIQSESTNSIVTDNGRATSRLICPLVDVVDSINSDSKENRGDNHVYHLSFYSQKIGIQFQKVPVTTSSIGALTEAMTADVSWDEHTKSTKTATELRRIVEISRQAKSTPDDQGEGKTIHVATPVDAVLVCGFHGFDDSANHTRPKLGARLVAFDGVSVEIGKWTFDSIRKAIQARGRPLTLSFRNDFLTMKQRSILTKAVAEVDSAIPLSHKTIQYKKSGPILPVDAEVVQSVSSASHETDHFVNDNATMDGYDYDDDDLSVSVASSNNRYYGKSFSNAGSTYGGNFRSFSEAGASSVISSTLGPLMANLMTGLAAKNEIKKLDRSPSYLNGGGGAVDRIPEFQDFKASLL